MLQLSPLRVCGDLSVRLLALELSEDASETYQVSFSSEAGAPFRPGTLTHAGGQRWALIENGATILQDLPLGSPDAVFDAALGQTEAMRRAFEKAVSAAVPYWPGSVSLRLASRKLAGSGTIAFDAGWFLRSLATSAFDRPILFPGAASKLGLVGLERASAILRESIGGAAQLSETLLRAVGASRWAGDGRLVGEYASGELAQLGTDIADGCRASIGSGMQQVVFAPDEPLGLSLGPLQPAHGDERRGESHDESIGMGVDVGEVEPGGAADRAGVIAGMVLSQLSDPNMIVSHNGRSSVPFEAVLAEIDTRRAAGEALNLTFDSAAPVTNLYAVEMDADDALAALAPGGERVASDVSLIEASVAKVVATLPAGTVLWREETPRLFLGEAGSMTCAHTDICPQLEVAHVLLGHKVLGVASHAETPRLTDENGGDEARRVPTDRPLLPREADLLSDESVALAILAEGDLAVFDSGALHFASNGADGPSGAFYYGLVTPAAVPRLRLAAASRSGSGAESDGAYQDHLFAADLLGVVEAVMASRRSGE